ncbi:hypothetical protein JOD31_002686 [Methylopila capsulata]|uniref:Uncharacterized protein n=1 Tax=Methylopila capsulata TaxID=61654 RepID=A0A9W6MST4_9HYPH|nr:hypothetical protein [Methylopila capsulata]MBM7852444.1 hypothetical protein [Methylopila capsulata]GLK56653.1 hypothetical protein GCM10008170_26720 [Methylopila capsulata]
MTRAPIVGLVAALTGTTPALADYPFCLCRKQADAIVCRAGFSDGETAEGAALEVVADDGTTLSRMRFGADSTLSFKPPTGGYYVLFDAGPGLSLEIDPRDIR